MPPVTLDRVLQVVRSPRAIADLSAYVEPARAPGAVPRHPGSRFEFLAGGGDRPEAADRITHDDLVAVSLLSAGVPGDVALQLLEGALGRDIASLLESVPVDVGIEDPAAVQLFSTVSPVTLARDLLEEPPGMDWFLASTLLARKRPRLVPVYDRVGRCAYGLPDEQWGWMLQAFQDDGAYQGGKARLHDELVAAREAARVPERISPLRVLDVIVWMRHRPVHLENGCPGLI